MVSGISVHGQLAARQKHPGGRPQWSKDALVHRGWEEGCGIWVREEDSGTVHRIHDHQAYPVPVPSIPWVTPQPTCPITPTASLIPKHVSLTTLDFQINTRS